MPLTMKQMREAERPYEKMQMYGAEKLSDAELLAIIIKTGTKDESALQLANRIMLLADNLGELENLTEKELTKIKGIGKVKAIQIKAVCELTKRISNSYGNKKIKMSKSSDVANFFINRLKSEKNEKLFAISLNNLNEVQKITEVAKGAKNVIANMSQVLEENIKLQSPKIILVHNHPSGNPEPSESDYDFTLKCEKACKIFSITFLDHIVVGNNTYRSIVSMEEYKEKRAKFLKGNIYETY